MGAIVEHLRLLMAYDAWATGRLLRAMEGVAEAERVRPRGVATEGLQGTLAHVLGAQHAWMRRCGVRTPDIDASAWDGIASGFAETGAALQGWVAGMDDADAARVIDFTDRQGAPHSLPQHAIVAHVANHGTQHRAEIGFELGAIGASPGDLDFALFLYEWQERRR
jgi:uncharacterized damage-inducible protein DinB